MKNIFHGGYQTEFKSHVNGKFVHLSQAVGKQEAVEDPNNTNVGVTRASKRQSKTLVTNNRDFVWYKTFKD